MMKVHKQCWNCPWDKYYTKYDIISMRVNDLHHCHAVAAISYEIGIKWQVKNVLNYKKPVFWIICIAIVAAMTVSVCLISNTRTNSATVLKHGKLIITNQTAQNRVNEVKGSAIPNFAELSANTEINFDSNGVYSGLKTTYFA